MGHASRVTTAIVVAATCLPGRVLAADDVAALRA